MSNPPTLPTTSSRLLAMAVALLGGKAKVQNHMKFSDQHMVAILDGRLDLTWVELDLLTTLLVREQAAMLNQNHDLRELLRLRASRR